MDKVSDERLASVPPPANKDEEIASLKRAMMYWNERAERAEVELAALRAAQGELLSTAPKAEPVAWRKDLDPPRGNYTLQWLSENPWPGQNHVSPLYAAPVPVAQQEPASTLHPTNIYDFAGWLTTRPGTMEVGSSHDAAPMAEAVGQYLRDFPERFAAPVPAPKGGEGK